MIDLQELQNQVAEWAARNFPNNEPYYPLLGLGEECGELYHAHLKQLQGIRGTAQEHHVAKVDAVGDIVIYLANYCAMNNINLAAAIGSTWAKVKQRDWQDNPAAGVTAADPFCEQIKQAERAAAEKAAGELLPTNTAALEETQVSLAKRIEECGEKDAEIDNAEFAAARKAAADGAMDSRAGWEAAITAKFGPDIDIFGRAATVPDVIAFCINAANAVSRAGHTASSYAIISHTLNYTEKALEETHGAMVKWMEHCTEADAEIKRLEIQRRELEKKATDNAREVHRLDAMKARQNAADAVQNHRLNMAEKRAKNLVRERDAHVVRIAELDANVARLASTNRELVGQVEQLKNENETLDRQVRDTINQALADQAEFDAARKAASEGSAAT